MSEAQAPATYDSATLDRRDLLKKAAVVAAAAGACLCCGPVGSALADDTASAAGLDVGPLSDYAKDGIVNKFEKPNKVLIVRTDGRLFAETSVCTHKGCSLTARDDQTLYCRCHGSVFTVHGTVDTGPAQRSLARYAISLNDDKHVIVDKSTQFTEKQWDDPKSFIPIT